MRSTLEKLRGGTGEVKQLAEQRLKLPIAEYRQQICDLVQDNQVCKACCPPLRHESRLKAPPSPSQLQASKARQTTVV